MDFISKLKCSAKLYMQWGHSDTWIEIPLIFLPKIHSLNPVMVKHQTHENWGTLQDKFPVIFKKKPKNTGVGGLSLLQWIFQTQESNRGLLHFRWILYQLSYQGSPQDRFPVIFFFLNQDHKNKGKPEELTQTE